MPQLDVVGIESGGFVQQAYGLGAAAKSIRKLHQLGRRAQDETAAIDLAGRHDDALGHLVRSAELDPRVVEWASGDADLAALRRMARVTGGEAYLAAEPGDILGVFAKAVLSR